MVTLLIVKAFPFVAIAASVVAVAIATVDSTQDNTVEYLSFGSSNNVRSFHKKEGVEDAGTGEGEGEGTVKGVEGRDKEETDNDLFLSLSATILLSLLSRMKGFIFT